MALEGTQTTQLLIEALAETLRRQLENAEIGVEKIVLFGSYARGHNTDASDIDLAVVSDAFTGVRFEDMSRIIDTVKLPDARLEIHPFTTTDFSDANPFALEILRGGVVLYDKQLVLV
jgi:predicted nucleotidyltransferase